VRFSEIAGQKEICNNLIQSVNNSRVSHAYLFTGPEGNGKLAIAIAFSQYINCINRGEHDSCGVCPSCSKYQKLIHPDLHFVFPMVGIPLANNKKAEICDDLLPHWRECLNENPYISQNIWYNKIGVENKQGIISVQESKQIVKKLSLKSFESEFKTLIIWLPEKMNQASANKLLKILEEPPQKTLIVLVAEEPDKIIPTILSRTQIVKIPRIEDEILWEIFSEKYSIEASKREEFIHLSEGNYIKALDMLDKMEETEVYFNYFIKLMRLSYARKVLEIIPLTEDLMDLGREKQKSFINYTVKQVRENFIMNILPENYEKMIYLSEMEKDFSERFHKYIKKENVYKIIDELNLALLHIERNANPKIVFMDLALKLNLIFANT